MIHVGKLGPVGAGGALILHLRLHRLRMLFMLCHHFRWPGAHLHPAGAAVKACPVAVPVAGYVVVVDVVHHGHIHVAHRAVVVKVAAAPEAALVSKANVAKAVIDTAIEADVTAPIAAVEAVVVMPVTPVAGGP